MKIIVQKFGGTSVRDYEGRTCAIKHIKKALNEGFKVIVVVSAIGRKGESYATDTLLSLVNGNDTKVSTRELDMLMSCGEIISSVVFTNDLLEQGVRASALSGGHAGFVTTSEFTNAKVIEMRTERLLKELESLDVVVVAGFQGVNTLGEVTTMGRGGSDTSAAALGVALKAAYVDIFTDVDGIMTADPRISNQARQIAHLSYNEVCNLAHQGAKVIHPRAVELAMSGNIPMRIRSTYADGEGTLVTSKECLNVLEINERLVTGIAHVDGVSQIKVVAQENNQNVQVDVFNAMAGAEISVDFINIYPDGVQFTVETKNLELAIGLLMALGYEPQVEECAKVSIVGAGISGVPGVTAKIVTPLAERGIQILQSADSFTTIWILVKKQDLVESVNVLHEIFELHN